jgi:GT2 family glycosyltransferase
MVFKRAPLASVVSLTYNRRDRIAGLLSKLQEQDCSPFEVIVVDNASTDGTADFVGTEFPDVQLLRVTENMGTFSYSLGIEAARSEYILLMDDDGLPAFSGWLSEVVARFEANPELGAVACTVRMLDTGKIAHDSPQFIPSGSLETGYPCVAYNGTGVGLRAAAIRPLMPIYPKIYFRSWIELYLCTNLYKAGWDVRLFPDIEVWHCRPSGSGPPVLSYFGLRNYYWYVLQFYPSPHWAGEILHHLSRGIKLTLLGQVRLSVFLQSMADALKGISKILAHREPISTDLLAYIRNVRRHGNWYGIAPSVVPYPGSELRKTSG